tara:strand:- start:424 stop:702 length:279 start_codon:yes stop_codon:yes gene_type:complete
MANKKAQRASVKIKDLVTSIKAIETLQAGRERGEFKFAAETYNVFDEVLDNFKCAIANVRGKKRNPLSMEIITDPEIQSFNAQQFRAPEVQS